MSSDKIALILCLDINKENKYEYECLYSILCWRTIPHELKDIDIILYIPNNICISKFTLLSLSKFEKIKIKYFNDIKFRHDLLKKIYCQYLFEKYEINYQYGIYIDLDLYLKKSFPANYICQEKNIYLIYKKPDTNEKVFNYRFLNNVKNNIFTFNTEFCFINRKNKICEKLFQIIESKLYNTYFNQNILFDNDMFYYEEGIYDYAYYKKIINDMMCRYINVNYFSTNSFFIHSHIRSLSQYMKLINTLKFTYGYK